MEVSCPQCGMVNSVVHYPMCGSDNPNQACPWDLPTRFINIQKYKTMNTGIEYMLCIKYRLLEDSKIVTEDYTFLDLDYLLGKMNKIISAVAQIEAIIIIPREIKGEKNQKV